MRFPQLALAALAASQLLMAQAFAQAPADKPAEGAPSVVTGGSNNVSIGNLPAARDGDRTTEGGTVAGSSPNVFINGKPAVLGGDKTNCGGIVVGGGGGVFINGKPAGRVGDVTTGCDPK